MSCSFISTSLPTKMYVALLQWKIKNSWDPISKVFMITRKVFSKLEAIKCRMCQTNLAIQRKTKVQLNNHSNRWWLKVCSKQTHSKKAFPRYRHKWRVSKKCLSCWRPLNIIQTSSRLAWKPSISISLKRSLCSIVTISGDCSLGMAINREDYSNILET